MTRAILLIDMDAFYASVEQARRPSWSVLPSSWGAPLQAAEW